MIFLVYSDNKASIPLPASMILILHRKYGKLHGAKAFFFFFLPFSSYLSFLPYWAQENSEILLVLCFIRKERREIHCFLVSQISQMDYSKLKDPFRVQSIFKSF